MIKVQYDATLRVRGEVELDMTEEQFDSLSEPAQQRVLESQIDWREDCRNAETESIEVDEIEEV